MNSQDLEQWDKEYVWHPFTQMKTYRESKPLIIERGEGSYLIDVDGKRYLDGYASLWVNVHGHNEPELNGALIEQVNKVAHSTLLGSANVPSILLAKNWQKSLLVLYRKSSTLTRDLPLLKSPLKSPINIGRISTPSSIGIKTNSSHLTKHTTAILSELLVWAVWIYSIESLSPSYFNGFPPLHHMPITWLSMEIKKP